ncbi:MAG: response regulator [Tepidisphaeraceae bacterium]
MVTKYPAIPKHVLVVDDEASIRKCLRATLDSHGYLVADVKNGDEALRLMRSVNFDLLLLDFNMPLVDGGGVLEALGRRDDHTPVIMLTAYASVPLATRMTRLGAAEVLQKPIIPGELLAAIEHVFTDRREEIAQNDFVLPNIDPLSIEQVLKAVRQSVAQERIDISETLLRQLIRNVPESVNTPQLMNLRGVVNELRGRALLAHANYRTATHRLGGRYWPAIANAWRLYDALSGKEHGNAEVALGDVAELQAAFGTDRAGVARVSKRLRDNTPATALNLTPPHFPRPPRN